MKLFNTVKWLLSDSGPISRTEKAASAVVVVGLNYLTKKAQERGDFHEANHNIMALLAGNSMHEHGADCVLPHDHMLDAAAVQKIATSTIKTTDTNDLPGFYL